MPARFRFSFLIGDLTEVDENLVTVRDATKSGLADHRWWAALHMACRHLLAGHIHDAAHAASDALQIASQAGEPDAFAYYAAQILEIRRAQGRSREIIELIEQAVADNPGIAAFRAALACALCEVDRLDDARDVFEPLVANGFTDFPFNGTWLTAMTLSADVAGYLEHRPAASVLADLLEPWRGQLAYNGITCQGSVFRPLGVVLATAGRLDEADEALAQAAAVHERIDAPLSSRARTSTGRACSQAAADRAIPTGPQGSRGNDHHPKWQSHHAKCRRTDTYIIRNSASSDPNPVEG
jgi:tetratricopeptide (TPR) repeat protein